MIGSKWGWYGTFYHLSNGDILKYKEVGELLITEALTFMAYEQDLRSLSKNKY